jgi:hypothetical protein
MMIESSAKTSKMIAAIAIPLQICKSILEVPASMIMRDVEAVSNANVMKLAEQIMGREEEVRQPTGAIVTTDDHKVVEGCQKVVLGDKEVDLVAGRAGETVPTYRIFYESQQWAGLILSSSLQKTMANQRRN